MHPTAKWRVSRFAHKDRSLQVDRHQLGSAAKADTVDPPAGERRSNRSTPATVESFEARRPELQNVGS
jgi:hypothetical protein